MMSGRGDGPTPLAVVVLCLTPLALAGLLAAGSTSHQAHDWLIVPGERVGPITATTTEEELIALLGAEHVERAEIHLTEDFSSAGIIGYPDDPERRFEVAWGDPGEGHGRRVYLRGTASRWHTAEGITLGTTLRQLETLNGGWPFRLMGFEWDQAGTIVSWGRGTLAHLGSVWISLEHRFDGNPDPAYFQLSGAREFSSGHPAMQRLNPTVAAIVVPID